MASGNAPAFRTLKECLEFLEWLHYNTGAQGQLANRLYRLLNGKYRTVDQKLIEPALSQFLANVSKFHTKLCTNPKRLYNGDKRTKPALNALLDCIPKVLAVMYFLQYHVDKRFAKVGGGDWADDPLGQIARYAAHPPLLRAYMNSASNIDKYLIAKPGDTYGVIPGGFGAGELKNYSSSRGQGYDNGSDMVTDLQSISNKHSDRNNIQNYFLDVYSTSIIPTTAGTQISNVANALRLVQDFCRIFEKVKDKEDFEKHLYLKDKCVEFQALKDHCKNLKVSLESIFKKQRFSFTGYAREDRYVNDENIAKKMASWFRTNLEGVKKELDNMSSFRTKARISNGSFNRNALSRDEKSKVAEYFVKNFFRYGFTFYGHDFKTWKYEVFTQSWDGVIEKLKQPNEGLDKLVKILNGDRCTRNTVENRRGVIDEEAEEEKEIPDEDLKLEDDKPLTTNTEAAKPVVTKVEAAKPTATKTEATKPPPKAEATPNQGKKAEGAQNQGKKAEGAQNQGKKAEGAQNQGKKAEADLPNDIPQAATTHPSSVGSPSSGASGPGSGRDQDGQAGASGSSEQDRQVHPIDQIVTNPTSVDPRSDLGGTGGGGRNGDTSAAPSSGNFTPQLNNSYYAYLESKKKQDEKKILDAIQKGQKMLDEKEEEERKRNDEQQRRQAVNYAFANSFDGFKIRDALDGASMVDISDVLLEKQKEAEERWMNSYNKAFLQAVQRNALIGDETLENQALHSSEVKPFVTGNALPDMSRVTRDEIDATNIQAAYRIITDKNDSQLQMFHDKIKQSERSKIDAVKQWEESQHRAFANAIQDQILTAKSEAGHMSGSPIKYAYSDASLEGNVLNDNSNADKWKYQAYANPNSKNPVVTGNVIPAPRHRLLPQVSFPGVLTGKPLKASKAVLPLRPMLDFTGDPIEDPKRNFRMSLLPAIHFDIDKPLTPQIIYEKEEHRTNQTHTFQNVENVPPEIQLFVDTAPTNHVKDSHMWPTTVQDDMGIQQIHPIAEPSDATDAVQTALIGIDPYSDLNDDGIVIEKIGRSSDERKDVDLQIDVPNRALHDSAYDVEIEDPYSNTADILKDEYITSDMTYGEDKGFYGVTNTNFDLGFVPGSPGLEGYTDPGMPQDPPRKTSARGVPLFPDSNSCSNPWSFSPSSNDIITPPTSPPPDSGHLPPPKTVREMLCWLVGLNTQGYIGVISEHVKSILKGYTTDAFEVTGDSDQLTASMVTAKLTETCLYAASVIYRIKYKDSFDAYETFFKDQDKYAFYYSPDPAGLLCHLRDYVYACHHQLAFLKAQCNRDLKHGGWKSHDYGNAVSPSASPLQAFLTDGWDSDFETHLFDPCNLCHKSRVRMGFKTEDLPKTSQQGSVISTILSPSCGGSDPLLTLASYLNCLTRRTPRTTGELVSYFHNFGNELHSSFDMRLLPLGESLSTPHPDCPYWDQLGDTDLDTLRGIRGSESLNGISKHNSRHDNDHPRTLSTLVGCSSDATNCHPHCSPITYRAYALYSQSFAHTYLSWTVYLPDRLWESLQKLHYDLQKHKCSGDKSLHSCSTALPLLYLHGFTPPEVGSQQQLKCSDVMTNLHEIVNGKPIATLMTAMDNILYGIREPFIYTLVALWSLAFLIFANTMLYRIDILHIRSHLIRTKTSHLIDVKAVLSDNKKMMSLYDASYFDDDPNELLNLK